MMAGRWSEGICNTNVGSGLVRWDLSCDDSRPVGTHIISTKNGALGRQAAVSGSGVGDSCSECSDLSWSVTGGDGEDRDMWTFDTDKTNKNK